MDYDLENFRTSLGLNALESLQSNISRDKNDIFYIVTVNYLVSKDFPAFSSRSA